MPSLASPLWKELLLQLALEGQRGLEGISEPLCTARLIRPTAFDALFGGQNCYAYASTLSQ